MSREKQRAELHNTIWKIANELRGSVDGWNFRQYVLGFLFYRFISENITHFVNKKEKLTDNKEKDYAKMSDEIAKRGKDSIVKEKGFFIYPSQLFVNVLKKAKEDENLNTTITNIFRNIENSAIGTSSENDLKGLFEDIDLSNTDLGPTVKARNELIMKIMNAIAGLALGNFSDNSIDIFGDAYEFLIKMYASNAGKSGGEFYTPQEVGELLAKITLVGKSKIENVYDPCCGSGGLLLKFAKIIGKENIKVEFFWARN